MVKCKLADANSGCGKDICCFNCEERCTCEWVCDNYSDNYSDIYSDNYSDIPKCEEQIITDEPELPQTFESKGASLIVAITDITLQKKKLEEQEKIIRQKLQETMEMYGVKKFENDSVSFTYVAPTTRTSIDSARLKKEMPEIAEKYSKTSNVSASVVIKVK